ncbi:MAG: KpsF/GutQ family sugar-phosphate isomerase [Betaproteobacteria bacterium]|nr:KpsF/GutQ family sugar-phosphate isomerase [Betaproteobacteria bacterium]
MPSVLQPRALTDTVRTLDLARETLAIEADAVRALMDKLGDAFLAAHRLMFEVTEKKGRVVVTGMGKSGHIGGKIASTLASTGTPAFFMHPGEASHGDLGMITADDVVIAISNSGESDEIVKILPQLKRRGTPIIAMTGRAESTLAKAATVFLDVAVEKEACPLNLAPTASTTATLALGDALAVALLDARGFGEEDYAMHHPGGSLGRRLLMHVSDVMVSGDRLPRVTDDAPLAAAIMEMSKKGLGMTAVVDARGKLAGVFTDGDLRRTLETHDNLRDVRVADVMNRTPKSIAPGKLAVEAAEMIERHKIGGSGLLVVDAQGELVGAVHVLELMRAGVL